METSLSAFQSPRVTSNLHLKSSSIGTGHGTRPLKGQGKEQPVQSSIAGKLKEMLAPDAQGQIHEEQLQHALVSVLLEGKSPEARTSYVQAVEGLLGTGEPPLLFEDTVKLALAKLVDEGLLDAHTAEVINGASFRAAQLDGNLEALYDGKGSASDPTIAVMPLEEAVVRAERQIQSIAQGDMVAEMRALDTPSNTFGGFGNSFLGAGNLSREGFLWKPQSERDGKLVVLMPQSFTGKVVDVGIFRELPASEQTLIERGEFSGDLHNGRRAHFRFDKSGGGYPDGAYVVATMIDGSTFEFQIGETSRRQEG